MGLAPIALALAVVEEKLDWFERIIEAPAPFPRLAARQFRLEPNGDPQSLLVP